MTTGITTTDITRRTGQAQLVALCRDTPLETRCHIKTIATGIVAIAFCVALPAGGKDTAAPSDATRIIAFEAPTLDSAPVDIGSRRELFVDNTIVGAMKGSAVRHLSEMTPATTDREDVAMTCNTDWEGSWCRYGVYLQDEGLIKAWYMGAQALKPGQPGHTSDLRTCYATSRDGRIFDKPALGLHDWKGSTANNVLFDDHTFMREPPGQVITHNFAPFIDTNPAAPPEARYKAVAGYGMNLGTGLYAFQSADGIHWQLRDKSPMLNVGWFDSINRAFWDELHKRYVLYFRYWRSENGQEGRRPGCFRDIQVCFSDDFVTWSKPQWLVYHRDDGQPGMKLEHLYTNEIKPYKRAPHIYLGFPARYSGFVEPMLMASRDGIHFYRWMEHPLISTTAPADRHKNRSNHVWQDMVELPDEPSTYSMYASENLGIDGPHEDGSFPRVRRFTIRKDGFVSVRAGAEQGELITKPLRFDGDTLTVNYDAGLNGGGAMHVEILDQNRKPMSGFTAADCDPLVGDEIDATVSWKGRAEVRSLAGKPIHLRFVLENADLFSFRFAEQTSSP